MTDLDDRLARTLGTAYADRFGPAPAVLPTSPPSRAVPVALGVAGVAVLTAAAVGIPLAVRGPAAAPVSAPRPVGSASPAPSVIPSASASPTVAAAPPVCTDADRRLTVTINHPSFPESVLLQKNPRQSMDAFVATGSLTGTSPTPCIQYVEAPSIGFVAPDGTYLAFNSSAPGAQPDRGGVLLARQGVTVSPADLDSPNARTLRKALANQTSTPTTAPVFAGFGVEYANNPYLHTSGEEDTPSAKTMPGTWQVKVTYGDLTAETPFTVTAG